jgi:hypothetical protein
MATPTGRQLHEVSDNQLQLLDADGAQLHRLHGVAEDTVLVDPDGFRVELLLGRSSCPPLLLEANATDSPPSFVVRQEVSTNGTERLDHEGPGFVALGREVSPQFELGDDVDADHCILRIERGGVRIIDYSTEGTIVIVRRETT